ncbi:MAG TPA: tetratricopeptide repeat protein [Sandaracinaceae bacterium LLY-WYZ-13_1]|nr:tetratricopeptide repeat protein [Sandaracinaceae bacterium LLY-WYZ-13_1]
MSWEERVGELVRHGSYEAAVDLLGQFEASLEDASERAAVLARRAELLDRVFLDRAGALEAWSAAHRLDPGRAAWLNGIREAQIALGRWADAAEVLERELGAIQDPVTAADLFVRLGDVLQEAGDEGSAAQCYRQATQLVDGHEGATEALADVESGTGDEVAEHLDEVEIAVLESEGAVSGRALLRAARLARRLGDERVAPLLVQAVKRLPGDDLAGAMLDDVHADDPTILFAHHEAILEGLEGDARATAARAMAGRWIGRFGDAAAAAALLDRAAETAPADPAPALAAARALAGEGDVSGALRRLDAASDRAESGSTAQVALLDAALALSRHAAEDSELEDRYAGRLRAAYPEHPSIRSSDGKSDGDLREASVSEHESTENELDEGPEIEVEDEATAEPEEAAVEEAAAAAPPRDLTDEEQAKLAELDEQIEKYTQNKRWSDVIKSIVAKAEVHVDPAHKVELYAEAGRMYLDKSSNQAEAIKCYESVLEHDPQNLEAIQQLKEMYEKRRDWESLVRIRQRAAKMMDEADRLFEAVEIAQLATKRLRKPDICIELWQDVLTEDEENPEALEALSQLYERSRDWEPLAKVLDKRVDQIDDEKELKQALQKLGMIYADKLGDDEGAVGAFQRLLMLDPDDRRAQEQLKRRYVALKAWDELEDFYAATEKWDELIRTLEREAEGKDTTPEERTQLLFRAARLWIDKKERPERAARAYEKVLAKDENNLDAALALSPIYEEAGDARKLVQVYEVRLEHAEEPAERVHLLRESGLLYEEKLRKPKDAFQCFIDAFKADPTQEIIREDVARLAEATNGWDEAIAAYREAIEGATDEDVAVELRLQLGALLTQVEKVEEAIEQYRAVYEARPDDAQAIGALEQLYRQTENYRDLLEIYERRMELEEDPETRRQLAYGRASLWENELSDAANAIDAYQRILDEWGDDESDAYAALDRLYESEERWADLASTLERRIDLGPESTEELAALKFRQANVLSEHLQEKERALELYREVLMLVPEHEGARAKLEAFLEDEQLGTHAATILEPIYEMQGQWEPLIRALEVLAAGSPEPERKLELLTKVGEVCGQQLDDAQRAFDAFGRAFAEMPESEETLQRLEALAIEQERFDDLVQLVEKLAGETADPMLARALWLKAAQIHDTQRNDVDAAVKAYNQVLEGDPGDAEVLDALDELYRRTERWRDLLGVVRRKAELADDPAYQEELLAQNAMIYEEMLEEPENAIQVYNDILELDPTSQRALVALDRLYERLERWTDLADNIGRQLTIAEEPEAQTSLMLRLGALRETRMDAVEAAIEIYREVLDRDPTNPDALEALERLIQSEEHQELIAGILEPIYRDSNRFEKLIQVHEIQAAHADSAPMKVELLHQIAELYEVAMDDYENAFYSYARALAEDPADLNTQDHLERIARATESWEALAATYEERVQGMEDVPLASQLYVKAATIREESLNDLDTAIRHYQKVLELDPDHIESATALERLFHMSERYEELGQILLKKAQILDIPDDQKDHLFRAAAIYEELLERPTDAIDVYKKVLEVDPEEVRALDKLIELHLRLEQWPALLEVYERKADIVFDPDEKKRIYLEVGAVYEREIGDVDKAIDTYQRILEIDPDDLTAIGRLDALYQASGNWEELRSILEREADLAADPNEVISYRYRIADLWDHKLGDPLRAVDIYRDILAVLPDHEPTLDALERMIQEGKEANQAALVLEPIYRQYGEFAKLVHVLEVQIQHEEDPLRKVELLHQVAELQEVQLEQSEKAFDAYARALPLDNGNEQTMAHLERLADELGAWARVTQLYDAEIEKLREEAPDLLIDMALRVAQIYFIQIGDVDSAIARYRTVLEADEGHIQAIEALDQLYEQTERWAELAEILDKEVRLAASPEDVLTFQFRLGQVYQHHLDRVGDAIEQYREILAAAPEHSQSMSALELLFAEGVEPLEIGEILEPLYRMSEAWDKLIGVHQVQLQYQEDPDERVQMMHRIAEIAEDRAGDHQTALEWMQRALLENPLHDHTLAETERLAAMLDRWDQLTNTYADVLASTEDAEAIVEIGKRQARTYELELGDVERAVHAYLFVLEAQPSEREALENLDRIYSEHGAHEALAETLKKRVASAEDDLEKVELSYRLGQVLESQLGRIDEAVEVYQGILKELDPEHEGSIKALENIYVEKQDWEKLFETFAKEMDVVLGDTARSDVTAKMARVAATHLNDPDRAIELWREVLDLRGEDPEALNELGNLYASLERWAELVEILDREVTVVDGDEARIAIFADMARIFYTKLEKERNAIDSWERVLDVDPTNPHALFGLAEIHRNAEQWHELVDDLNRIIEVGAAVLEDHLIETVYMQLGDLYEHRLEQPFDAVEAYNRCLEVNPRNFQAMDALERIHRREGEWVDAIRVMEQRQEALDDPGQKVQVLLAIAEAWATRAEQPDQGTSAYERILELDPMHRLAFDQLEQLHQMAGRWEALIEVYLARVDSSEDIEEVIDLLRRIAKVYEEKLEDLPQAQEALTLAWEQDFTNEETGDELERVAALTKEWNEPLNLANTTLQELQGADDAEYRDIKIALCLRCAKWYGHYLNHPEYAVPYYNQILALDPTNYAAMQAQADLHRHLGQWQQLAQMLGRMSEIVQGTYERASVFNQMGELCEDQLQMPEQGPGYYRQAIEADPTHLGALGNLERLHTRSESWDALLDVLRMKVTALEEGDDPSQTNEARLQVAELLELRFERGDEAIEEYRKILENEPTELRALKGLERLYAQREGWQSLYGVLERQFELVTTEKERVSILIRLASMLEEEFLKPDQAAERLERVLEIDPNNMTALRGLERLYRNMQLWEKLIETYDRHVLATPERAEKVECYAAIGEIYANELGDPDRAVDSYLNLLSIDEDNAAAIDALARLYEKREDYPQALDMMNQLARLLQEPQQVVDLRYRMGRILDEHLADREEAVQCYRQALDVEPGHLPSLEAMRKIYLDSGDWLAAARTLEQETEHTQAPRRSSELLVELGRLYDERLEEHALAVECWEKAYARDNDNEDAALPLAEEYVQLERYEDAYPLLDMLVKRSGKRETDEQHRLAFMLGDVALRIEQTEAAIKSLTKAYQLDQQHLPTLLKLADAFYQAKDWDKAFKYYQMLLVHHRDSLGRDEITDVFYKLGVVKREQGDRRKALNMFDKALEEDPHHRPTLEAMVGVYEKANDFEQVIHYKKQVLEIADIEERFEMLVEIGDLWNEKVKNAQKAIEAYAEASALEPDNHRLLHKLLMLYQQTKQWDEAIEIIQRISDLDEREAAKAKYAYTVAVILRDEVKDMDRAIEKFDEALDLDRKQLKAFEAINKILTQKKDWKQLERAFRKMVHRIRGKGESDPDLEYNLWHNLGVIYRDRLKHYESAVAAFEEAAKLNENAEREHVILAELHTLLGPDHVQNAIDEHQWLLRRDPYRVDSYQALYKLYFDARAYDKAWCLAATLTFLKKADAEQQQFFADNRPSGPIRPQNRLNDERWLKDLVHQDQDLLVSKIFEQLWGAILSVRYQTDKEAGLNPKHEVDPANSTVTFARTFGFVANVLGLTTPRLFLRTDVQGGLTHMPVWPQASLCGATLLSGFQPGDLMFVAGRHLSDYRGEHYIRTMLKSNTELKTVLMAGLRLSGVVPQGEPAVEQAAQQIAGKIQPAQRDALKSLAKRFVDAGARTDIKRWLQCVELTSCRTGFLVCNDLETAARMVTQLGAAGPVDLAPKEKVKELVLFSVSEEYFRLREHLGIRIALA